MRKTRTPINCVRDASPASYTAALPLDARPLIEAAIEALALDLQARPVMSNPKDMGDFCCLQLSALDREVFAVAFLDTRHRLIAWEELFYGSIDGCEVHPGVIAKRALLLDAAAVVLSHNHPSGNPEPSAADRAVTARIKQALALIDVRLLDHIVVGGTQAVSLAGKGWV